jgi:O-glycosyl hydrolase
MVAFKNPDGEIVVIVMNNTEDSIKFALKIEGKAVEIKSEARSIMTLLCE